MRIWFLLQLLVPVLVEVEHSHGISVQTGQLLRCQDLAVGVLQEGQPVHVLRPQISVLSFLNPHCPPMKSLWLVILAGEEGPESGVGAEKE